MPNLRKEPAFTRNLKSPEYTPEPIEELPRSLPPRSRNLESPERTPEMVEKLPSTLPSKIRPSDDSSCKASSPRVVIYSSEPTGFRAQDRLPLSGTYFRRSFDPSVPIQPPSPHPNAKPLIRASQLSPHARVTPKPAPSQNTSMTTSPSVPPLSNGGTPAPAKLDDLLASSARNRQLAAAAVARSQATPPVDSAELIDRNGWDFILSRRHGENKIIGEGATRDRRLSDASSDASTIPFEPRTENKENLGLKYPFHQMDGAGNDEYKSVEAAPLSLKKSSNFRVVVHV
jgi:hypothetical protein